MGKGEKTRGALVVAGGDVAVLLEASDEPLDRVPPAVGLRLKPGSLPWSLPWGSPARPRIREARPSDPVRVRPVGGDAPSYPPVVGVQQEGDPERRPARIVDIERDTLGKSPRDEVRRREKQTRHGVKSAPREAPDRERRAANDRRLSYKQEPRPDAGAEEVPEPNERREEHKSWMEMVTEKVRHPPNRGHRRLEPALVPDRLIVDPEVEPRRRENLCEGKRRGPRRLWRPEE